MDQLSSISLIMSWKSYKARRSTCFTACLRSAKSLSSIEENSSSEREREREGREEKGKEISLSGMPVNDNGAVNGSSTIINGLESSIVFPF